MGNTFNREITLLNQSGAGNGNWYLLDWKADTQYQRNFQGNMNASDTIQLQIADSTQTYITTVTSYTGATTFNGIFLGNVPYVRAVKSGTNGTATVIMWG